jgi:hypothetical protein
MARWRQAVELAMTDEEIGKLTVISRSRTEPASRVERAQSASWPASTTSTDILSSIRSYKLADAA